jgi:DNA-binding CsgD family transcriptional regulator
MNMTEKIRILLIKRGNLSEAELARRLKTSPQNFHNKLVRNNFSQSDLEAIAEVLDCDYKSTFILRDTKEEI